MSSESGSSDSESSYSVQEHEVVLQRSPGEALLLPREADLSSHCSVKVAYVSRQSCCSLMLPKSLSTQRRLVQQLLACSCQRDCCT